jgi:2-polyprenyl-3-methyl-5-hydroxy-6-metoxy-1,4-benzoquinol methylase
MANFWDERYSAEEYIFGKEPNVFFKSVIDRLEPGRILVPAAGEGRDAVYAATLGWDVIAMDQSSTGKEKAMRLAAEKGVTIRYDVQSIEETDLQSANFDAVALIYFHLPPAFRQELHKRLPSALRPNGTVIIEAFTPAQIGNTSGGPTEPERLLTKEILITELGTLKIIQCEEVSTVLAEGSGHVGKANVLRFVAKK